MELEILETFLDEPVLNVHIECPEMGVVSMIRLTALEVAFLLDSCGEMRFEVVDRPANHPWQIHRGSLKSWVKPRLDDC